MDKANLMNHQVISTEQNSGLISVKTHYGTYHHLCLICWHRFHLKRLIWQIEMYEMIAFCRWFAIVCCHW